MLALIRQFEDYFVKNGDARVESWPLMSSIYPTLALVAAYIYWVKIAGPKYMKDRKPFDLKSILIVYNLFQVIFSTWMFVGSLVYGHEYFFTLKCMPFEKTSARSLQLAAVSWWYYFSKFTEFLDTIFFVLRKKDSQVSVLHVIHHSVMPVFGEL